MEPFRREIEVSGILIHHGWDPDELRYAHDIALLKLKEKIQNFTPTILPICIKNTREIANIKNGTIVGFGEFNEMRGVSSDVALKVDLPIIETSTWLDSEQRKLAIAFWKESFTAGSKNAGICPGDSGSGYYVKSYDDGRFYLRGVVSSAFIEAGYNCTHNNYALYSDVLQYLDNFIIPVSINSILYFVYNVLI